MIFSKHHIENILAFVENMFPFLSHTLTESLEKQKKKLFHGEGGDEDDSKPIIARIWEVIITLMILYFLISMINSFVNERLEEEQNTSLF